MLSLGLRSSQTEEERDVKAAVFGSPLLELCLQPAGGMTKTAPGKWEVLGDSEEGCCSGMQFHKAVYDRPGLIFYLYGAHLLLVRARIWF